MRSWCKEFALEVRKVRRSKLNYSQEQKKEAVIQLAERETSAKEIAERYHVRKNTFYDWKSELIGKELPPNMSNLSKDNHSEDLKDEIEDLKKQVYKLKMEKDILKRSADLIKMTKASIP